MPTASVSVSASASVSVLVLVLKCRIYVLLPSQIYTLEFAQTLYYPAHSSPKPVGEMDVSARMTGWNRQIPRATQELHLNLPDRHRPAPPLPHICIAIAS